MGRALRADYKLVTQKLVFLEWGQLSYEKAERSLEAPMQPVVEHLIQECRREHREIKGEQG